MADSKAIVRRFVMEGLNKGNMAVVDEVISPNAVDHALPPGMPPTRGGVQDVHRRVPGRVPRPDLYHRG